MRRAPSCCGPYCCSSFYRRKCRLLAPSRSVLTSGTQQYALPVGGKCRRFRRLTSSSLTRDINPSALSFPHLQKTISVQWRYDMNVFWPSVYTHRQNLNDRCSVTTFPPFDLDGVNPLAHPSLLKITRELHPHRSHIYQHIDLLPLG